MRVKIARIRPRLPPLNVVRAFVAAARHQSPTHAALELRVTRSTIGLQINALEAHLGVGLFERKTRQALLTAAAGHQIITSTLAPEHTTEAFDLALHRGTHEWPQGM